VFGLVGWSGFLSGLHFCRGCRDEFKVRLSDDVGVAIHWVDGMICFDVFLLLSVGKRDMYPFVLYCEVYNVESIV